MSDSHVVVLASEKSEQGYVILWFAVYSQSRHDDVPDPSRSKELCSYILKVYHLLRTVGMGVDDEGHLPLTPPIF